MKRHGSELRTERVVIRLTPAEKQLVRRLAAAEQTSMSRFLVRRVLDTNYSISWLEEYCLRTQRLPVRILSGALY